MSPLTSKSLSVPTAVGAAIAQAEDRAADNAAGQITAHDASPSAHSALFASKAAADLGGLGQQSALAADSAVAGATAIEAAASAQPSLSATGVFPVALIATYNATTTGSVEQGYMPAAAYSFLWTRDMAYMIQHQPNLFSSAQIRAFAANRLATRTTASTPNPDGGFFPADFVADRIDRPGTATYKNPTVGRLPFMDGIHFVVLSIWTDFRQTGDASFFTANLAAINSCLSAIPRSGSGCVYSDPAAYSVDYGFTDSVTKTGDVLYGTALQAWACKMCAEMAGETTEAGAFTVLRRAAEAGIRTLRKSSGWYSASSVNSVTKDDVWGTALVVAEGLCTTAERLASARTIATAYAAGTITQSGWVRHLPIGQFWTTGGGTAGTYQNGGFWATPLYDCIRAVALSSVALAQRWANEALLEYRRQVAAEGVVGVATAPYEWVNVGGATPISDAKGYCASAAVLARFAGSVPGAHTIAANAPGVEDSFATNTSANYSLSGFSYNSGALEMRSAGSVDGERFTHNTFAAADASVTVRGYTSSLSNFVGIILRYTDANNYIFCAIGGAQSGLFIYDRIAGVTTQRAASGQIFGRNGQITTTYSFTAWVVGTTVRFRAFGQELQGTTTITGSGGAGVRLGHGGAGFIGISYFRADALPAATLPNDVSLAHDTGLITPGGSLARPIFGVPRLLDARGNVLATAASGIGPVTVTTSPQAPGAIAATSVINMPAGNIAATTVQSALNELDVEKAQMVAAPATSSSPGTAGWVAYDATYFYVCTATNTWKRNLITTF